MIAENKYVRFDWAVKRMLRDKANIIMCLSPNNIKEVGVSHH